MRKYNFNFYFQTLVLAVVRFQIQNENIKFQLLFSNSGIGGSEISKSKIKNFNFYFQTVVLVVVRFQNPKWEYKISTLIFKLWY